VISNYASVPQSLTEMMGCLASGFPFIFGFTVYESFESNEVGRSGVVPMPNPYERVLGGHDVLIFGYDQEHGVFHFRNSWGDWGDQGGGTFPMPYCTDPNLSSGFWVVNALPGWSITRLRQMRQDQREKFLGAVEKPDKCRTVTGEEIDYPGEGSNAGSDEQDGESHEAGTEPVSRSISASEGATMRKALPAGRRKLNRGSG
jgi:hypothetical protein